MSMMRWWWWLFKWYSGDKEEEDDRKADKVGGDDDYYDDEKEADRKIEKAGAVEGTGGTAAVYLDPSLTSAFSFDQSIQMIRTMVRWRCDDVNDDVDDNDVMMLMIMMVTMMMVMMIPLRFYTALLGHPYAKSDM